MLEEPLLDLLADDENAAGEFHIFVVDVAAIADGIGVSDGKILVRSRDRDARRCLNPVVNSLLPIIETFQANGLRNSFHDLSVTQSLAISDVVAVRVLLLIIAASTKVDRILGELKNIRTENV